MTNPVLRDMVKQYLAELPAEERDALIGEAAGGSDGGGNAAADASDSGGGKDRRSAGELATGKSVASGAALYDRIGPKRFSEHRVENESIGAHEYDFR